MEGDISECRQPTDDVGAMAMGPVIPVTRRNINDFPTELLDLVLTEVKRSSQPSRDRAFTHCLVTCSSWGNVGVKVLWTDIHITNESLAAFCASGSTYFSIIRTLTSTLRTHPFDITAAPAYFLDASGTMKYGFHFGVILASLPEVIKKMDGLESFSLVTTRTDSRFCQHHSINKYIRKIIDALPQSLHHLEIDTRCFYDTKWNDPSEYLCPAIAGLLPRLNNLRLKVGWLCNEIFRGPHAHKQTLETPGNLVINTVGHCIEVHGQMRNWPETAHCTSQDDGLRADFDFHWPKRNALVKQLSTAMKTAVDEGKLSRFSSCSILTQATQFEESVSQLHKKFNTVFESRALPSHRQVERPFYEVCMSNNQLCFLLRDFDSNAGPVEVALLEDVLALHVEGNAWLTIENDCRVPASYLAAKPRFGHITTDCLNNKLIYPVQDSKALRAAPQHFLSKLEAYSGHRLLRAVESTDLDDFDLVERDTSRWEMVREERKLAREAGEEIQFDAELDTPCAPGIILCYDRSTEDGD